MQQLLNCIRGNKTPLQNTPPLSNHNRVHQKINRQSQFYWTRKDIDCHEQKTNPQIRPHMMPIKQKRIVQTCRCTHFAPRLLNAKNDKILPISWLHCITVLMWLEHVSQHQDFPPGTKTNKRKVKKLQHSPHKFLRFLKAWQKSENYASKTACA